jgi:YebC/PmpR family DNA-binding regulatory protein
MGRIFEKRKHKIFARMDKMAKAFTRVGREIAIAVKQGGADPSTNSRLRQAIANAKGVNMPKDNIERAIKKASSDPTDFATVRYEGHAPGGIALIVECATDNTNRTVANIRSYFTRWGGNLGSSGSVEYLFEHKGEFVVNQGSFDEESLAFELIDAGAEDVELHDGQFFITTSFEDFGRMQKKLEEMNAEVVSAKSEFNPLSTTKLDPESAKKVLRLVEAIEEDDDVQAVYHSLELTEEVLASMN